MNGFFVGVFIMLGVGIPIAVVLMRILFKKSVFWQIGSIWIGTVLFSSINNSARIQFESYPQAIALPLGILVVGLGIYFASRYVKQPLNSIVEDLTNLSKGDTQIVVSERFSERNDEIGEIAKAVQSLSTNLNSIVKQINHYTIEIKNISDDLNKVTGLLSRNSESQNAAIEGISVSMEEIGATIQQNLDSCKQSEKISEQSFHAIAQGNKSAMESIAAMDEVAGKVKLINDIAFQTNILALNAAVEASRAGDAGKGFAVVAQEVRKLAESSNKAAREVEGVSNKVLSLSRNSGSQLQNFVEEARLANDFIKSISAAGAQQNSSVQQINYSVQQLNKMIQSNGGQVENIQNFSNALALASTNLKKSVSVFKVR
jgi:methyl-accepting chemotaxis protein